MKIRTARRRGRKVLFHLFVTLPVLCLLLLAGFATWLHASGPRALDFLKPAVIKRIELASKPYQFSAADSMLGWQAWGEPITLQLTDAKWTRENGAAALEIPSLEASIRPLTLLGSNPAPERLVIERPAVHFEAVQTAKPGDEPKTATHPALAGLGTLFEDILKGPKAFGYHRLELVRVSQGTVDVAPESEEGEPFLLVPTMDLLLERKGEDVHGTASAELRDMVNASRQGSIRLTAGFDSGDKRGSVQAEMTDLPPASLCAFIEQCDLLQDLTLPLNGTAILQPGTGDTPEVTLAVNLQGRGGNMRPNKSFIDGLAIHKAELKALLAPQSRRIELQQFAAQFEDATVSANATAIQEGEGWGVKLDGKADGLPVDYIYRYWPADMATNGWKWVKENIRNGTADGTVKIDLKPTDNTENGLPEHALSADVLVRGGSIRFNPDYPVIDGIDADVHFTGKGLKADIKTAKMMSGATASAGTITMPDLQHPNLPIDIVMELSAPAVDVAIILNEPYLDAAPELKLDLAAIQGNVTGKLTINAEADDEAPDQSKPLSFELEGDFTDFGQRNFMGIADVSSASGHVLASKESLVLDAKGNLAGTPVVARVETPAPDQRLVTISGDVPVSSLETMGLPARKELSGTLGMNVRALVAPPTTGVEAMFDLAKAELRLPPIDWSKPTGTPGTLKLNSQWQAGQANRSVDFSLSAADLNATGSAGFNGEFEELQRFAVEDLRYGQQKLSVVYEEEPGAGYDIRLTGDTLDLSDYLTPEERAKNAPKAKKKEFSISNFPPVDLVLDLKRLVLIRKQLYTNVNGELHCDEARCPQADISGNTGEDKPFRLTIGQKEGARRFLLTAADAGAFLNGLGVVDGMRGGTLELKGTYDDNKTGNPLGGYISIEKFIMRDTPLLSHILNLTSLTGLVDTFSGRGISFDGLKADIGFVNDEATIKDGRMAGGSIGLTADGKLNVAAQTINIKGTLVPAYMFNSALSKIPLLGAALSGGEGKGIFAFNFSMRGSLDDPKTTVNPLSVLTPGFLRGIFGVFDSKAPEETEALEEQPASADSSEAPATASEASSTDQPPTADKTKAKPRVPTVKRGKSSLSDVQ